MPTGQGFCAQGRAGPKLLMPDVFISYASSTRDHAQRTAEAVRALGYDVWLDDQLPPHRSYSEVIEERLGRARAVIVLWSAAAVQSQWVRAEADFARTHGTLVQVTLDGALPPMPFNQIQCADLSRWKGGRENPEWLKVASSLAEIVGRGAEASPRPAATPARRRLRRPVMIVSVLALVLLASAVLLWGTLSRLGSPAPGAAMRVAVLPFDTVGDSAGLRDFASGLLDETLSAMRSDQVQALSRTDSLALRGSHAGDTLRQAKLAFFLDGVVSSVGDQIRVKLFLNDARDHTAVWSTEIVRAATEADALQAQVAARSADVAHLALVARSQGGPAMDTATLAKFVDASDQIGNGGHTAEQLLREVVAADPNFAMAHARLALVMGPTTPDQPIAALLDAKRKEARHALDLDPHTGEAYILLWALAPPRDWSGQEALLTKGVAAEPDLPYLWHFYNKFLGQTGRTQDALAAARRTAALNYMFVGGGVDLCVRLAETGQAEATESCQRADRLWPNDTYDDMNQLVVEMGEGEPVRTLARLKHPDLAALLGPKGVEVFSQLLRARIAGDGAAAKAAALSANEAANAGSLDRRLAYVALAATGQVDPALGQARSMFVSAKRPDPIYVFDTSILFTPATQAVRRDQRFLTVARDLGLLAYWRASGKWPDFCAEPGLPYDCRKAGP